MAQSNCGRGGRMAPPGSNKRMGPKAVFVPRSCHHDTQGPPSIFLAQKTGTLADFPIRHRGRAYPTRRGVLFVSTEDIREDGLVGRAVDWAFGYDFFISYNHGDGPKLPLYLKERLTQAGFRVFLDQTEYVAGLDLRRETRRQITKSRKLVVIARQGALRSVWVK